MVRELFKMGRVAFLLSMPASIDGASHGLGAANIVVQTTKFVEERVEMAFASSAFAITVPMIHGFGLGGIAFLSLVVAFLCQGTWHFFFEHRDKDNAKMVGRQVAARLAGFAVAAKRFKPKKEAFMVDTYLCIVQQFAEVLPTALIQTSFAMGLDKPLSSDIVTCVTLLITVAMLVIQSFQTLVGYVKGIRESVKDNTGFWRMSGSGTRRMEVCLLSCYIVGTGMPILIVFLGSFFILLRVYGIEVCESHAWGITSGCVPVCSAGTVVDSSSFSGCLPGGDAGIS